METLRVFLETPINEKTAPYTSLLWLHMECTGQSEQGGEEQNGLGGGIFHCGLQRSQQGTLGLAWETSLKVTLVKIELVWEGMENSCSCLPQAWCQEGMFKPGPGQGT